MSQIVKGILKEKFEELQVTDSFKKREFILTTDNSSQYPQEISFQLSQAKTDLIDPYKVGQEVEVSYNLRGRAWTNPQGEVKYFNTLDAWKIQPVGNAAAPKAAAPDSLSDEDDLPF